MQMNDGAQVELTIEESSTECGSMSVVTALEEIAKLPIEKAKDRFSGADIHSSLRIRIILPPFRDER